MDVEVRFTKDIPKEQISRFEDRVVYNTAVVTREYVKNRGGYPYLTGKLARSEIKAPIIGNQKEYGLLAGTNYAKYVYKMKNVKWTNPRTMPKWYYTAFRQKGALLLTDAVIKAMREIK